MTKQAAPLPRFHVRAASCGSPFPAAPIVLILHQAVSRPLWAGVFHLGVVAVDGISIRRALCNDYDGFAT